MGILFLLPLYNLFRYIRRCIMEKKTKELLYVDEKFYENIKTLIQNSKKRIYQNIENEIVLTYWNIGRMIVEKQGGESRARYGDAIIKELSVKMTNDFGKGYSERNLEQMRKFYTLFQKPHTLRSELSWSHYRLLISLDSQERRNFYIKQTIEECWSTRQLERAIRTFVYERYLESGGKQDVINETIKNEPETNPLDVIKKTYVLEFTGINPDSNFYESELEQALIDHLQEFLLELGKGFSFVARQRRFDIDDKHFYVDLVFYNYKLKCFVLIDLKRGELTHQDLGQMQMYVNYYTRDLMEPGDNPPIGVVLCTKKSDTLVRYTLPLDNKQIFASKYMLYLPNEDELRNEINKQREIFEENHLLINNKK